MKRTAYMLLFIGLAGLVAAIFGLVKGENFTDHVMTMVCGASLIYGYFQLKNHKPDKS